MHLTFHVRQLNNHHLLPWKTGVQTRYRNHVSGSLRYVIFLSYPEECTRHLSVLHGSGESRDLTYREEENSKAMEVDEDGSFPADGASAMAEQFALLKRAVKDAPLDYGAHLALVGYLRQHRPCSLDLLKAREE